jgi:hypothetical protein
MVTLAWLSFEVVCLLVALLGLWIIFPPAAMIVGGVAGAVAAERAMAERGEARRKGARR